jgi:hypothetical protein
MANDPGSQNNSSGRCARPFQAAGINSQQHRASTVSNRQRNTHIWEADPYGHYPEPLWTSARLFEVESFGAKGALILDPCSGWGRIPHNAVAAGYSAIGIGIVDRQHEPLSHIGFKFVCGDFLKDPLPIGSVWSAVFNPPFTGDCIQEFVERTLAIVKYKVAALVPIRRPPGCALDRKRAFRVHLDPDAAAVVATGLLHPRRQ